MNEIDAEKNVLFKERRKKIITWKKIWKNILTLKTIEFQEKGDSFASWVILRKHENYFADNCCLQARL